MSLKELKGLAPWQWDSQTKKHAIGPKGLQDFTEITRILQKRPTDGAGSGLSDTQKHANKRRRSVREGADASAGLHSIEVVATPGADGTATPSIKISKKVTRQPGSTTSSFTPMPAPSGSRQLTPTCWQTPAASAATGKAHSATVHMRSEIATAVVVLDSHCSAPAAAGSAGQIPAAGGHQGMNPASADVQDKAWHQHHSKDSIIPACAATDSAAAAGTAEELAVSRQEGPEAAASHMMQQPHDAFSTPMASAASLLVDVFSPSPIPTPAMPGSTRAGNLASSATAALDIGADKTGRGRASRLDLVDHSAGQCKQQEVYGAAAGAGADRVTPRGSTFPVPKLQFTPASSMKPPVNKRRSAVSSAGITISGTQQHQQLLHTPAAAAATAGKKQEPSPTAVLATPKASGGLLMTLARATSKPLPGAGFQSPLQPLDLLLSAASMESPHDDTAGQEEAAEIAQQLHHSGAADLVSCAVGGDTAAAAAQATTGDDCCAGTSSLLLLPAKLRCKGANRSCAAATDSSPGLVQPANSFGDADAHYLAVAGVGPSAYAAHDRGCGLGCDQQQLQHDSGCGSHQVESIVDDCRGFLYELAEAAAAASSMDAESPPQQAATAADPQRVQAPALPAPLLGSSQRSQTSPTSAGKIGLKRWWRCNRTAAATEGGQTGQQELQVQQHLLPPAAQDPPSLVAQLMPVGSSTETVLAQEQMAVQASPEAAVADGELRLMSGPDCQAGRNADNSTVGTASITSPLTADRAGAGSPAAAADCLPRQAGQITATMAAAAAAAQELDFMRNDAPAAAALTVAGAAAGPAVQQGGGFTLQGAAAACKTVMTVVDDAQGLCATGLQQDMAAAVVLSQQHTQAEIKAFQPAQTALLVSSTTAAMAAAPDGAGAAAMVQAQGAAAAITPPNPRGLEQSATAQAVEPGKLLITARSGKQQRARRPRASKQQDQQPPLAPLNQPRKHHVQSWNVGTGLGGSLLLHSGAQVRLLHQVLEMQQQQQQQQLVLGSGTSSNINQWLAAGAPGSGALQFMPYVVCGSPAGCDGQGSAAAALQPQQAGPTAVGNDLAGMVAAIQGNTAAIYGDRTPHVPHAVAAAQYHLAYGAAAAEGAAAAAAMNRMITSTAGGQLSQQQQQQQVMQLLLQMQQTQQQQREPAVVPAKLCVDFAGAGSNVESGGASVAAAQQQIQSVPAADNGAASQQLALGANVGPSAPHSTASESVNKAGVGASATVVPGTAEPAAAGIPSAKHRAAAADLSCNNANLPGIAPLELPDVISEEDCWKMAQAQPWLIQQEADRARQLLASLVSSNTGGMLAGSSGSAAACLTGSTAAGTWAELGAGRTDMQAVSAVGGCQNSRLGERGTWHDCHVNAQDTLCAGLHMAAGQGAAAAGHGVVTGVLRQQRSCRPALGADKWHVHQQAGAAGNSRSVAGGAEAVLRVIQNN